MSSIKEKVIEFVKHMPEGSTIDDIVNALEEQKEIVENMDEESSDARVDMVTLSEASLKDFLETEPDIYTDKDLKVKFHWRAISSSFLFRSRIWPRLKDDLRLLSVKEGAMWSWSSFPLLFLQSLKTVIC